jgi:hypothetical protein
MTDNARYYVYLYLRQDGTPYYVGKGSGTRAWSTNKLINLPVDKNNIIIVGKNLYESEAFLLEKKLIREYGRKDMNTGILRNLTDGGDGIVGWDGINKTYDERFGKEKSLIVKLKKSKSMMGKNKGVNSALYGKKGSNAGKTLSDSTKKLISEARVGDKNPRHDDTEYSWQNIKTGEVVTLTRYELCERYNLYNSNVQLVLQGKQKRVKDWKLK